MAGRAHEVQSDRFFVDNRVSKCRKLWNGFTPSSICL